MTMISPQVLDLQEQQFLTVDGLPALPGEDWRAYHDRALEWIAGQPELDPSETQSPLRRLMLTSLVYVAAVGGLVGMAFAIVNVN